MFGRLRWKFSIARIHITDCLKSQTKNPATSSCCQSRNYSILCYFCLVRMLLRRLFSSGSTYELRVALWLHFCAVLYRMYPWMWQWSGSFAGITDCKQYKGIKNVNCVVCFVVSSFPILFSLRNLPVDWQWARAGKKSKREWKRWEFERRMDVVISILDMKIR